MASFGDDRTASSIRAVTKTGSHLLKVFRYSLTKGIGIGKYIDSDLFTIGGYKWRIKYYPDGHTYEHKEFISLCLELRSAASDVKTKFSLHILQQNGLPFVRGIEPNSNVTTFKSTTASNSSWRYYVANRNEFEASECLKDDAFTVRCVVTVVKGTKVRAINSFGVDVPPPTLHKSLSNMLRSGNGKDVTFLVKGEEFHAHRCVLAARSAVFNAMFFGCMKEKGTDTIMVNDIEASTFKSMLKFIYTDSFFDSIFVGGEEQDYSTMVAHLLVAADRYALETLRLECEYKLSMNLSVNNVVTTIILAERHNCHQLKAQCLKLMSLPEVFTEVALTPGFEDLMKIVPSLLKDIKALKLNGDY